MDKGASEDNVIALPVTAVAPEAEPADTYTKLQELWGLFLDALIAGMKDNPKASFLSVVRQFLHDHRSQLEPDQAMGSAPSDMTQGLARLLELHETGEVRLPFAVPSRDEPESDF